MFVLVDGDGIICIQFANKHVSPFCCEYVYFISKTGTYGPLFLNRFESLDLYYLDV